MSFKIKSNRKRQTVQEQAKAEAKTINLARNLLGLPHDLPDALEDTLSLLVEALREWFKEGYQHQWGPGDAVYFMVGGGKYAVGDFRWRTFDKEDFPILPPDVPRSEIWEKIAGDIESRDIDRVLTWSGMMMGKDGRSQIRKKFTQAGIIPALIVLVDENSWGEHTGAIYGIHLPTLSTLKTLAA